MNGPTLYNELIDIYRSNNLHSKRIQDRLLNMINNKGAVLTVKELIRSGEESFGVEDIVLKSEFSEIFNEEDKEICRRKLSIESEGVNTNLE